MLLKVSSAIQVSRTPMPSCIQHCRNRIGRLMLGTFSSLHRKPVRYRLDRGGQKRAMVILAVCVCARWVIHTPMFIHCPSALHRAGVYPRPVEQWGPKVVSARWCIGAEKSIWSLEVLVHCRHLLFVKCHACEHSGVLP